MSAARYHWVISCVTAAGAHIEGIVDASPGDTRHSLYRQIREDIAERFDRKPNTFAVTGFSLGRNDLGMPDRYPQ